MSKSIDITAVNELQTFAILNSRLPFAHLCTEARTALEWGSKDAQWAVERMAGVMFRLNMKDGHIVLDDWALKVIDDTDTTRPDGGIAKGMKAPV